MMKDLEQVAVLKKNKEQSEVITHPILQTTSIQIPTSSFNFQIVSIVFLYLLLLFP